MYQLGCRAQIGILFSVRLGRSSPDTAPECGDVNPAGIGCSKFHSLDVREWQLVECLPTLAQVPRKPQPSARRTFGECHVNPIIAVRIEIAAEGLRAFTSNTPPIPP